ncbi:NAD-dependent epimerase/dehydratase family protein [Actinomadura sp. ATCC 31491]|uniref:NAD-dependent epimerase/dehydratase family protein n=1 Tax=Actinomadura luzonensis TaxID=2805427 RepID=A0ABT0G3J7_9ACTN|nr:NAD-dependent epimerase/dehydratase family protein [Actinomadura luzonensis]MCK2219177.1 NAD-dependent epimerase/dehydratase family protein [Actinomadura luzonensis]
MDVFVTGGSGFIGRHLLRALTEAGHRVRALARSDAAAAVVEKGGAEAVRGDLLDRDALRAGMAGCAAVVHAAAVTDQWGPPSRFLRVNVDGTRAVLDAAREAGAGRLVLVSTEAVLADGGPLVRVDESRPRPARPAGWYARSKALAEDLVLTASERDASRAGSGPDGLVAMAVRPRLVWGPGDTTVLPEIVKAARAGRFAWVDGGRYLTSTCHVGNACHGILCALERGRGGRAYFLTDGEPVELRAFLTALAATAGVRLPGRSLPRGLLRAVAAAGEAAWRGLPLPGAPPVTRTFLALSAQEMTVDDTRARTELGYRPLLTREQGLAELAAGFAAGDRREDGTR